MAGRRRLSSDRRASPSGSSARVSFDASSSAAGAGSSLQDVFSAVRSGDVAAVTAALVAAGGAATPAGGASSGDGGGGGGGVSVLDSDRGGRTVLHVACGCPAASASDKGPLEVVRFLLQQGGGVNMPDRRGNTPLHVAAKSAGSDVVKLLLGYGADALERNHEGQTPYALAQVKARRQVSAVLKAHMAEVTAVPNAPSAPRLVRRTSASLAVGWAAPAPVGNAEHPVTSYDMRYSLRGVFTPWITKTGFVDCGPAVIDGLRPGSDYVMQVRARNKNGPGAFSAKSITMTTLGAGAPPEPQAGPADAAARAAAGVPTASVSAGRRVPADSDHDLVAPPMRSESLQALEQQRDHAEARARELREQRSLAENAMVRIDREREALAGTLAEAQAKGRELRQRLRDKDAMIKALQADVLAAGQAAQQAVKQADDVNEETGGGAGVTNNLAAEARLQALDADRLSAERRAQTAEDLVEIFRQEAAVNKAGRAAAEANAAQARAARDAAETRCAEERQQRDAAEAHAARLESLVAKLQRQRDAAEALAQVDSASSSSGGGGGAVSSGGSGGGAGAVETIAELQRALEVSDARVFELAGVETQLQDVEARVALQAQELSDASSWADRQTAALAALREERDSLRVQRDAAEKEADEARGDRSKAQASLQDLRASFDEVMAENEAVRVGAEQQQRRRQQQQQQQGSDEGGASDAGAAAAAHAAAEIQWKGLLEASALEVLALIEIQRKRLEGIESLELSMQEMRRLRAAAQAGSPELAVEADEKQQDHGNDSNKDASATDNADDEVIQTVSPPLPPRIDNSDGSRHD